jgi:hypothetical protein
MADVSESGKTFLAKGMLYAEGLRRLPQGLSNQDRRPWSRATHHHRHELGAL